MSNDDLNTFLVQFMRGVYDPSAPLPDLWPTGIMGVFLVFATQFGAAIPLGVIMARNAGISPLVTASLYFASDLLLPFVVEPMLALLRWLARRYALIGRLGQRLAHLTGSAGLHSGRVRGPLGLILLSFTVSPQIGRAASVAAGYGFFAGWTFAIIGDMGYFVLIMASTLWVSSVFGDDRLAVGAVLIGTWVLPMVIRRIHRRHTPTSSSRPLPVRVATSTATPLAPTAATRGPRKRTTHAGRRRARDLHR